MAAKTNSCCDSQSGKLEMTPMSSCGRTGDVLFSTSQLEGRPGDEFGFGVVHGSDNIQEIGEASCLLGEGGNSTEFPCSVDDASKSIRCRVPKVNMRDYSENPRQPLLVKRTDAIDAEHRFAFSLKSDLDENDADISIVNGDDAPSRMQSYLGSLVDRTPDIVWEMSAELLGTFMIVFAVVSTVAAAVLTGAQMGKRGLNFDAGGIWQVAIPIGIGVMMAIYCTASISGAHLNPAVSLALAITRPHMFHYGSSYRSGLHSILTAMMFGEYFPNPGDGWYISQNDIVPAWCDRDVTDQLTGHGGAFFVEMLGTAILMLVILSVTDKNNVFLGDSGLPPVLIGLTVSMLISFCAPLTQAGFNPARDFGPRLAAASLGWGATAIPGPRGGFWVYIVGPSVGALLGTFLHDLLVPLGWILRKKKIRANDDL